MAPPAFRPLEVVIHPDVDGIYAAFEEAATAGRKPESSIWKSVQTAIGRIKMDGLYGETIRKSMIPADFVARYGVNQLYCVDLALFHRMFYTIKARRVILLDLVDHPTYDHWFPGKKRR